MHQAGIATATGTRVDSAAKHTMACKVDSELFLRWFPVESNSRLQISTNKMKYAMQKDELVLNVTQMLDHGPARSAQANSKAYPAVVTSTGDMSIASKERLAFLYGSADGPTFLNRKCLSPLELDDKGPEGVTLRKVWRTMPYFTVQGYALGTAWASEKNGDTVGTVLVGGMVTVRNGAFTCRSGQPMMFYFDFEESSFFRVTTADALEGERKDTSNITLTTHQERMDQDANFNKDLFQSDKARKRQRADEFDSTPSGHKSGIALPKPYVLQRGNDHFGDRIRVFAKCINGGRPHDMIDLMLMTQSL